MNQDMIGYYGMLWMEFMEENHPKLAAQMQKRGTFEAVARSVHRSARDYCKLLMEQYAQHNPPPDEPEEYQIWESTRDYYIDSAIMRERVLVAVTSA